MAPPTSEDADAGNLDEDPAFLEALLLSYMERTAEMSTEQSSDKLGQTPAASTETIRHLPLIELRAEDLVDPVCRECCVCLEEHEVGDTAVRMPHCSHIFHKECIVDWLQRKCTCPLCQYEHPTEDIDFEQGRLERMKQRKPRYARHELDRMTLADLEALLPSNEQNEAATGDEASLIQALIESGAIDVIQIPEPTVEYKMSALQKMSVSQLRRCMNKEAGVFCQSKDINKKEDMIKVFIKSGRLRVLPETCEVAPKAAAAKQLPVESKHRGQSFRTKIRRLFQPRE